MRIDEVDGIWASASLLHVPRDELHGILRKLGHALKIDGVMYVSFKHGTVDRQKDGRHFTDMTETMLREELRRLPQYHCLEVWTSEDVRPDRSGELWVNALIGQVFDAMRAASQ